MGLRKTDPPARRKMALIRRGDTESATTHTIGGIKKQGQRNKPSLPKMPWDTSVDYASWTPDPSTGSKKAET